MKTISIFWPWITRYRQRFEGEAGGEGGEGEPGGGAGADAPPEWHGDHSFFDNNPEGSKAFSKYASADEAFKGAHEAMKRFGKPYHMPEDHSKLTAEQKGEIMANVAKMQGVPESPDGYEITVPDDSVVDPQGIEDWKAFCHERGMSPTVAQEAVDFQLGFVGRLNEARDTLIKSMTKENFKTFVDTDCAGDKELAGQRMEQVKQFMQTHCTDAEGKPDKDMWEAFQKRTMHGDRMIELPLLRALSQAAQMTVGTGGAPMGAPGSATPKGALDYPEMKGK